MLSRLVIVLCLSLMVRSQPTMDLTNGNNSMECCSNETEMTSLPCPASPCPTAPCHPYMTVPSVVLLQGSFQCSTGLAYPRLARDDYRYSPGIGAHKLHMRATTWNNARKMCNDEGGHLAIVNSMTEAHILTEMFSKAGVAKGAPYPDVAFLGFHDLYMQGEWVTILGDSLFKTGYTTWSDKYGGQPDNGGQPDKDNGNQHCGGFFRDGGLDDVNCQIPFAFFCELPITCFMR